MSSSTVPLVRKAAVIVGIDYVGQESALQGCRSDARNMHTMLVEKIGVERENISFLVDGPLAEHAMFGTAKKPVRAPNGKNIMQALVDLAYLTTEHPELEEVWITYSGHGSYLHNSEVSAQEVVASTEDDGRHETIVPVDYSSSGMIVDDTLNNILCLMRPGVRVVAVFDSCHSETVLDLRYRYVSGIKNTTENPNCKVKANCVMISGCRDTQTSADAPLGPAESYQGAMCWSLLKALEESNFTISCYNLLKNMRLLLKDKEFSQVPQITCSRPLSSSTMFVCYNPEAFSQPAKVA